MRLRAGSWGFQAPEDVTYYDLNYLLENGLGEKAIQNTQLYDLVRKLSRMAFPTYEDKYDKRWECFYVSVMRSRHLITVPFSILEYQKDFFVWFQQLGNLCVKHGGERAENEHGQIFRETMRFIPLIKATDGKIFEKTIPYDIRTGKVKGCYVMKRVMPRKEKKKIFEDYDEHMKEQEEMFDISLNDYLNVAAVCYRAAFKGKAGGLSPLEMYKKWADGRDGGMLSVKKGSSCKEFMKWKENGRWAGSHPFEIVFSWHEHGIHLYPPYKEEPHYSLGVTNYAYAESFVEMVKALIKNRVPFKARDLENVLNYLSGETYFEVNSSNDIFRSFTYAPSRENKKLYFGHIEWDEIKIPRWR